MNNQIVPWFNSDEWFTVYNVIFSNPLSLHKQAEGIKTMLIWKARCPSLPSGIESTFSLLQIYVQDMLEDKGVSEHVLRLTYSSAIMRFVNHMLDAELAKGASLYKAAKHLGVPDWIIDLRHDIAHNDILPSVELLREATKVALEWLHKNYWDKHKDLIHDCVIGNRQITDEDEQTITSLIQFYTALSICAPSSCTVKYLADIPDKDMRESIVLEARELFDEYVDFSDLTTVSVVSLINLINTQTKKLLKSPNCSSIISKALVADDSLFLSPEMVQMLCKRDFLESDMLSKRYVKCFEILLTFLHSNNIILDLTLTLISITKCSDINDTKRKLAALWISQILQGLQMSKRFLQRINKKHLNSGSIKKKHLKKRFQQWFPNETLCNLVLDLEKPVPKEFTDLCFIQPIISTYNPYLTYFIRDLLNLLEPELPRQNIDKICSLAQLISKPQSNTSIDRIYTVKDLQVNYVCSSDKTDDGLDSDCIEINPDIPSDDECSVNGDDVRVHTEKSNWTLASTEYNWATCPVGLLPWQEQESAQVVEMETE